MPNRTDSRSEPPPGCRVPVTGDAAGEAGFLTIQHLVVVGLSLVFVTVLANLIVFQYGRGVVRAALDEGARAGSRVTAGDPAAVTTCEQVASGARAGLLGGHLGRQVDISCGHRGAWLEARAAVTFPGWLPLVPDWSFEATARARQEVAP